MKKEIEIFMKYLLVKYFDLRYYKCNEFYKRRLKNAFGITEIQIFGRTIRFDFSKNQITIGKNYAPISKTSSKCDMTIIADRCSIVWIMLLRLRDMLYLNMMPFPNIKLNIKGIKNNTVILHKNEFTPILYLIYL